MDSHTHSIIDAALPLDEVSIQHKIDLNPAEARRFADRAGSHGVESWRLRQMIRQIDKIVPPMNFGNLNGSTNPNNGRPHHWYTIGKEYSRVVYLNVVKAYLKHSPFDYDTLTAKLNAIAARYGADEHYTIENSGSMYQYRIWWD